MNVRPRHGNVLWSHCERRAVKVRCFAQAARGVPEGLEPFRWPRLRQKAIASKLDDFFLSRVRSRSVWVAGAEGSGAATAVESAFVQHAHSKPGVLAVMVDCEAEEGAVRVIERALEQELPDQLNSDDVLVAEALVQRVVTQYGSSAVDALLAAAESVQSRTGLAGVLPRGTEVAGCQKLFAEHREDVPKLISRLASAIATSVSRQGVRPSVTRTAMAFVKNAGSRDKHTVEFLLAATAGWAGKVGRDVFLVLLRAEVLTRVQSNRATMSSLEACALEPPGSGVRLLLQSRDGVAVARAMANGSEVVTIDQWSEDMARAIFVPRFLPADKEKAWKAIWALVGGHPAHLRRLAEFLHDGRRRAVMSDAKQQLSLLRQVNTEEFPGAKDQKQLSDELDTVDDVRIDARGHQDPDEMLLRRFPEVFTEEIAAFEQKVSSFIRHPALHDWRSAGRPGRLAATVVEPLRSLCASSFVVVPEGVGNIADPVMIALLDVGDRKSVV